MRLDATSLPRPVIDAGRSAIRGYGIATSWLRGGPDFLLVGGKRCGSTSLYFALLEHPRILPLFPSARLLPKNNHTKGVHYFDSHHDRGTAWYRSHFPASMLRNGKLVGDGSPYYLFHPLAAERAAREAPDARILLVVRNPVERAFSHFRERRRENAEPLETFEEALAVEDERLDGEEERILADPRYRSYAHEHLSYRAQGEYAPHLRRWMRYFPAEQVHVLVAEDFYADPQRACDAVANFLGIGAAPLPAAASRQWNAAPARDLLPATRSELTDHYAPFNKDLEDLLDRKLGW
ncbi:sulfotransferase domain-containing protein [Myceligenerans indicum]|uniref:Sulfotransferase domain-containing protein n=1 Tax=Myceligenerans indicum TaxID=2593663 RepID=A0ABS1LEJ8_9MICO|nr:sulfotransferase domain-containing protein [Myceligenerans indicum]MBL0884714.1 sulfotransferase domain-containing protein [Myceligenerans indicum]